MKRNRRKLVLLLLLSSFVRTASVHALGKYDATIEDNADHFIPKECAGVGTLVYGNLPNISADNLANCRSLLEHLKSNFDNGQQLRDKQYLHQGSVVVDIYDPFKWIWDVGTGTVLAPVSISEKQLLMGKFLREVTFDAESSSLRNPRTDSKVAEGRKIIFEKRHFIVWKLINTSRKKHFLMYEIKKRVRFALEESQS